MKKLKTLITALMLFSGTVFAAPFLTSDPDPTGTADTCSYIDGTATQVDTPTVDGGCKVDLARFSVGTHNLQVSFKNTLWNLESNSVPFVLVKPGNVGDPASIKVAP